MNSLLRRFAAAAVVTVASQGVQAPAQQLTPSESIIVKTVDAENSQALEMIRKLVDINSGTMNLEGVRAIGKMLTPEFEALGFSVRWIPMDEVQRAGHLVAEHPCPAGATCGKRMLLIGHMDTVFEKDSPFQSYTVSGTTGTGPGTNDMKGGLVAMIYALKAMQAAGVLKDAAITIVLSGDEEKPGHPLTVDRQAMIDVAKKSDVALEFEGTVEIAGQFYGSISRRSSTTWRLETTGESGHSSGIFSDSKGYGAIYELVRILDEFREKLPEPYLTYNVGMVLGGSSAVIDDSGARGDATGKDNVIPPVAVATGDIRTLSNEQTARVQAKMKAIVDQHLAKTGAKITFNEGYPAMAPTAGNRALLRMMNGVNRSLGQPDMPELDPMKRGAGDIAFVAPYLPGLAGVGASGEGAHAPGETIDLLAQPLNTKRVALLMYQLTQMDAKSDLNVVSR